MHQFKKLKVWQKSIELATQVHQLTKNFPTEERFGLVVQINRSAVSIASNIAEGAGRNTRKEFNLFLGYAVGSAFELETQLVISNKLSYIEDDLFETIRLDVEEIQKMLYALKKQLQVVE
ncbi:MAG: four helix bundle protein [Thermonemataceae bacterium]